MLALDYFGRAGFSGELLRAYGYVQDGDLWTWALPGSRQFAAGLSALELQFDAGANPGIWDELLALDVDGVVAKVRGARDRWGQIEGFGVCPGWRRAVGMRLALSAAGRRAAAVAVVVAVAQPPAFLLARGWRLRRGCTPAAGLRRC